MGSKRFSGVAVLFSMLGAGLSYVAGEFILKVGENWPPYLEVALYFGVAAMIVGAMILGSQGVTPQLIGYRWREQYFKTSFKFFIPTTLLMVGMIAGLLQFLYGLEINEPKIVKDIVIAVDKSSSMMQTDPNGERYNAISSFIDHLSGDKRVALMTFSDDVKLEIDFTKASSPQEKEALKTKIVNLDIQDDGQTAVGKVVDKAYELIKNSGRGGSLILISDGGPTDGSDSNISGLVQDYVAQNIPIYTIGMMYADPSKDAYLNEISELTGGVYYATQDTAMLNEVFEQIKYNAEKGTIVSMRTGAYVESTLHVVLRIGFLTILAVLMALALGIMFDNKYLVKGMLIGAMIGGLIGSILTEVYFSKGMHPYLVRGIYWICFGLGLMTFTWCVTFKDNYHGTREA